MQTTNAVEKPWAILATDKLSCGQTIKVVTEDLKLVLDGARAKRFESSEAAEGWLAENKGVLAGKSYTYTVMML